jgi:hypothetical protein
LVKFLLSCLTSKTLALKPIVIFCKTLQSVEKLHLQLMSIPVDKYLRQLLRLIVLMNYSGDLVYRGVKAHSGPMRLVLVSLTEWLKLFLKLCIVVHNLTLDGATIFFCR